MGLKDVFKGDSKEKNGQQRPRSRMKPQYNKNIARKVSLRVKALVPYFGLPEDTICEQCIETGVYYLIKIVRDPAKLQDMKTHLIKDHYSKPEPLNDDEVILRMGEENDVSEYLKGIRTITKSYSNFRRTKKPGSGSIGDIHALVNFLETFERFYLWFHQYQSSE